MFTTPSQFKRKFKLVDLKNVPGTTTPLESVCRDAVFHHYIHGDAIGPKVLDLNINAILTNDDGATIYVHLHPDVEPLPFNRKLTSIKIKSLITEYHKTNRRLSRVLNINRILSKKDPLFISYSTINRLTKRIIEKPISAYEEYKGILTIIGENIAKLETDRLQIIPVMLPQILPTQADLLKLVTKPTSTLLKSLKTFEDVSLVEAVKTLATDEGALKGAYSAPEAVLSFQDGLNIVHIDLNRFVELKEDRSPEQIVRWVYDIIASLTELRSESMANTSETYYESLEEVGTIKGKVNTPEEQTEEALKPLLTRGSITEAEYNRHVKTAETYKKVPSPLGTGTLEDEVKRKATKDVTFKPKKLPKMVGVDNSKLSSAKRQLDEEYITKELNNDLVGTFMSVQQGPFAVTNLTREEARDAGTHNVLWKLQTKALKGGQGTAVVDMPVVKADGTFQAGGVDYRMAVQRVTFPIAKIGPNEVTMNSAVSKVFLTCGEKKASDYPGWVLKNVMAKNDDGSIKNLVFAKHKLPIDMEIPLAPVYAAVGAKVESFNLGELHFNFSVESSKTVNNDKVRCGSMKDTPLFMDQEGMVYAGDTNKAEPLGTLASLLGLSDAKAPRMFAELKVKGKQLPVIAILAYWLGFSKALNYLMLDYRVVKSTERIESDEYAIKFSDAKVAVKVKSSLDKLLVYGWHHFRNELVELKVGELDAAPNFSAIFTPKGITRSHEIELDIMRQYWIDPNTAKLLASRDYPTEMIALLVRCTALLTHRQHYEETDGRIMLERGYCRLNDIAYGELVQGIREFYRNPNPNRKLTINPEAVKHAILMDESVSPVERVNPVGVMGEQDRIVYAGNLGRSSQSMVGRHRVYHPNDRGRISEAFTDDGKAGAVLYYATNPEIENYYGVPKEDVEYTPANLVSFAYMNNPFVTFDDGKRGNFSRIQANAMRACNGATIPPVMTNAGLMVAARAGRLYALVSKQEGKVVEVTDEAITIKYKDGTEDSYGLGLQFGAASGKTYPRDLVTDRKKGYKFGEGEVLAWDKYHLFRDRYNPTQTNIYNGTWDIVAFRERAGTYEDASRMSQASAEATASDIVHIRPVTVTYDDNLKLNIKVGDTVDQDQALAYLTPPGVELTSAEEASSLDYFSASSPKAKYDGKVVRIEAYYMGDKNDASPELLKVINASDKARKVRAKSEDIHPTGEYKKSTYIQKQQLIKNTAVILVYIMHEEVTVAGDKVANANSLKTVPGKIYETRYTLPDGTPINSDTSYKGLKSRITPGAELLGVLGLFSRQVGLNGAKAYRNS